MRRMLDPKEAGGSLPSTITFDQEGNRTASKDVKVDGKLKLKSLVSASNPDGDITKELGGGGISIMTETCSRQDNIEIPAGNYRAGKMLQIKSKDFYTQNKGKTFLIVPRDYSQNMNDISVLLTYREAYVQDDYNTFDIRYVATFLTDTTLSEPAKISLRAERYYIPVE